jgi:restriction system protein
MVFLIAASDANAPGIFSMLRSLAEALLLLWPLWLLVAGAGAARLALELHRLRRLRKSGISEIDAMDGHAFEQFLGSLFRRLGYRVEMTSYHGDYGADLIVTKDGQKTAVQAKRRTKRAGIKAVQEAVGAKRFYGCDKTLVVANRDFTAQARRLARANEVELWGREELVGKLLAARSEEGSTRLTVRDTVAEPRDANFWPQSPLHTNAPTSAACAACGVTVSKKVLDYCFSRPQRFGTRIYCFGHQRRVDTRPGRRSLSKPRL